MNTNSYIQLMESYAAAKLIILPFYFAAGLLFFIFFVFSGKNSIDTNIKGSSLGFYIFILPSILVLWPILVVKSLRYQDTDNKDV